MGIEIAEIVAEMDVPQAVAEPVDVPPEIGRGVPRRAAAP
jgi:hypothetical protein